MLKTMIPTTSYTAFGIPWGIIDQRLIISARTVLAFRGLHQIAVDRSRSVGLFMVLAFWSSAAVSSTETSAELCREGGGGGGGEGSCHKPPGAPQAAWFRTSHVSGPVHKASRHQPGIAALPIPRSVGPLRQSTRDLMVLLIQGWYRLDSSWADSNHTATWFHAM